MIDWYAEQSDKFIGTAAAIAAAIAAGATASTSIYAAHKQGDAAEKSAQLQTDAAKYGADKQDAAAQRAEAFQRQQAENEWLNSQNVQRANYDQSKARYGSIAGVASQYGLNLAGMPDYAPGIDPHYDTGTTPTPPAGSVAGASPSTSGAAPSIDPTKGDLAGQISAYFKSRGVSDEETPYWVSKWSEFGAKDPAYFNQRLAAADIFGKSGGTSPAAKPGTIAAVTPYQATAPAIAPTTGIPTPYQPGTIAAYGRMR